MCLKISLVAHCGFSDIESPCSFRFYLQSSDNWNVVWAYFINDVHCKVSELVPRLERTSDRGEKTLLNNRLLLKWANTDSNNVTKCHLSTSSDCPSTHTTGVPFLGPLAGKLMRELWSAKIEYPDPATCVYKSCVLQDMIYCKKMSALILLTGWTRGFCLQTSFACR